MIFKFRNVVAGNMPALTSVDSEVECRSANIGDGQVPAGEKVEFTGSFDFDKEVKGYVFHSTVPVKFVIGDYHIDLKANDPLSWSVESYGLSVLKGTCKNFTVENETDKQSTFTWAVLFRGAQQPSVNEQTILG